MKKNSEKKRRMKPGASVAPAAALFIERSFPAAWVRIGGLIVAAIALGSAGIFLAVAWAENGFWGFPLDDPWIHLCFARNLAEFGSYSYFQDQLVTSGSTSPVYTLVLAALHGLFSNEFLISYFLGMAFFSLSCFWFLKLAVKDFNNAGAAAFAAALLMALQPRLALIAVSGMETTMFIFLIVACVYAYRAGRSSWTGLLLGLCLWCRPDGIIIWIAIAADMAGRRMLQTDAGRADEKPLGPGDPAKCFGIALLLALVYGAFNYYLSGEVFPNTYKAKLAYYQAGSLQIFLRDVFIYFSAREFLPLSIFFCIGAGSSLCRLLRGRYSASGLYLVLFGGFVAAYCLRLPIAHRFGRYLMPLSICYIMLAVAGLGAAAASAARLLKKNTAGNALWCGGAAAALIAACSWFSGYAQEYAYFCKYHDERHVVAGKWINANTPREALIATHDIGAVAYYGNRKVLDMVGLVTPEVIPHIRDADFNLYLERYLTRHKVTHIVVLTSWFEIVNSQPLFSPVSKPEIIQVHAYNPGITHIQSGEVSAYNREAMKLIEQEKNYDAGLRLLEQSQEKDPGSSQTLLYLGYGNDRTGRFNKAEQYFSRALALFPEYVEAQFWLARAYAKQGRRTDAFAAAQKCLKLSPQFAPALQLVRELKQQER